MRLLLVFLICVYSTFSFSMNKGEYSVEIKNHEIILDSLFDLLRNSTLDSEFQRYNQEFIEQLEKTLELKESFSYPFKNLVKMSKLVSPDGEFRLFNWNVESQSGVHSFYCYILKKNGTIIKLRDNHRIIERAESKSLTHNNWYGALYYKIIVTRKGRYTLLGWNGKDGITTQKVMETMSLSRRGAKFGFNLFEYPSERKTKKRVILTYSDEAIVSVKHYKTKKTEEIVFSHLSPSTPQMTGFYQYYYPDLSFDKFVLTNGKWIFESDSLMKNEKSNQDDNYNPPE